MKRQVNLKRTIQALSLLQADVSFGQVESWVHNFQGKIKVKRIAPSLIREILDRVGLN